MLFRSKHWEEVGGRVRELLADKSKCEAIFKGGEEEGFVLPHVWDVCVKESRSSFQSSCKRQNLDR